MSLFKHFAWLALLGMLHGWGVTVPSLGTAFDGQTLWWLQMLALLCLLRALVKPPVATFWPVRFALAQGFVFALGWLASSLWWIYVSLHTYGGLNAVLAVLSVLALSALLATFYAAATGVFMALQTQRLLMQPMFNALLFAACWMGAELLRGTVMTGLPWVASGYAHLDSPLSSLAPRIGVYGIGSVAALLVAWFLFSRSCLLKIVLIGILWGLAPDKPSQTPSSVSTVLPGSRGFSATLLQGNIPQNEKFDMATGVKPALSWYAEQIKAAKTDVVFAPETAIPLLPADLPEGYLKGIEPSKSTLYKTVMSGIPLVTVDGGYTNSVMGMTLQGDVVQPYRYNKHHLVAFGEFIPPTFRWFTNLMNIPLGDFDRGAVNQASMTIKVNGYEERLAPMICFEDLFGEELAARFTDPAKAPTVLVSITNLGWFGNTVILPQHLNISRMRAIEFDRPVVRATNTGVSGVIDSRGRLTHHMSVFTKGALTAVVSPSDTITPYALWVGRYGLSPLFALSAFVLLLAFVAKRKEAR